MNGRTEGGRIDSLDSVRGLAALAVVINHCLNVFPVFGGYGPWQPVAADPGSVLGWLLRSPLTLAGNGRAAVAIFFVLSGFVLALPWFHGRPPSWRHFVIRRVCRIYLPYAAAVALAMILATVLASDPSLHLSAWFDANWTEPVTAEVVADQVLMLGGHNTFDNAVWSLDHEMRISLLFPLLLLPVLRFGWIGAAVAAVAMYGTAGAITHFGGWHGAPAEIAATIRFGGFFILGAVLASYSDRLRVAQAEPAAWLSLVAGLTCLWLSQEPAVMAIGSGLVIMAAILPGGIRRTLDRPSLRWLGRISYSLYLIHLLVLLSAVHLLARHVPPVLIVFGAGLLSLPVAAVFHHRIEAPSDRLGRRLAFSPAYRTDRTSRPD